MAILFVPVAATTLGLCRSRETNTSKARPGKPKTWRTGRSATAAAPEMCGEGNRWAYPTTRRDEEVVDTIGGREVKDPYRWLEDPDAAETAEWVDKQNAVSREYIGVDVRERLLGHLKAMNDYEKLGCPFRVANSILFFRKDGSQNQSVLYAQDGLDGEPRVVLDPNTFTVDGTASLGELEPSLDGSYLAYTISLKGSDWRTIHVLDFQTGEHVAGTCSWARYTSIAWTADSSGFYYSRYPTPEGEGTQEDLGKSTASVTHQMVYYHALGTQQEEDRLVYQDQDHPDWNVGVQTTDDGRYLLLGISNSCAPQQHLKAVDLEAHFGQEKDNMLSVVDDFVAEYHYVANDGPEFYVRTNRGAPRNRIVRFNMNSPDPSQWHEVLAEHSSDVLVYSEAVQQDKMLVVYQRDVKHVLELRALSDASLLRELPLPDLGCVQVSARRRDADFFFLFTSFIHPGTTFNVDLSDGGEPRQLRQVQVPQHEPSDYHTEQVFFTSKDGTRVPMFLVKKRSLSYPLPCQLYGYGGFMISITPRFSLLNAAWMRLFNGVFVVANIRGGDEYGEDWHNQGIIEKKQNCFNDFQAAAEHLVASGVTQREKLWIMGGSNGGLLVGACINQRPDLFGAAVACVGVMDMLRFHKFGIGRFWTSDFGDPDNPEHVKHIMAYSPLHNVRDPSETGVSYPPTLLMTADHDDRVAPLHSYKYAAELQHVAGVSSAQNQPLLLLVDTDAGHGAGKPTTKVLEEAADRFSFISRALKVDPVDQAAE